MGSCDSRTGRSTAIAHLVFTKAQTEKSSFFLRQSSSACRENGVFCDVIGYVSLVRVFVGRITPNLLVSGVFGTFS